MKKENPLRERIEAMAGTADQKLNALNEYQNKYHFTKAAIDNIESIRKELLLQKGGQNA
jgi:hypothetical protein